MKIYLFNPESGVYLGEDFTDAAPMCQGRKAIPLDATIIPPPPYRRGEVPVFSVVENKWKIRPVACCTRQEGDVGSGAGSAPSPPRPSP